MADNNNELDDVATAVTVIAILAHEKSKNRKRKRSTWVHKLNQTIYTAEQQQTKVNKVHNQSNVTTVVTCRPIFGLE